MDPSRNKEKIRALYDSLSRDATSLSGQVSAVKNTLANTTSVRNLDSEKMGSLYDNYNNISRDIASLSGQISEVKNLVSEGVEGTNALISEGVSKAKSFASQQISEIEESFFEHISHIKTLFFQEVESKIKQTLSEHGVNPDEVLEGNSVEDIVDNFLNDPPTEIPPFPYFIMMVAIIQDTIDLLAITGFGLIIIYPIKIKCTCILLYWMYDKISGVSRYGMKKGVVIAGAVRKHLIKKYEGRVLALALDFIPIISFIPWQSIFVLLGWLNENKFVRAIMKTSEVVGNLSEEAFGGIRDRLA